MWIHQKALEFEQFVIGRGLRVGRFPKISQSLLGISSCIDYLSYKIIFARVTRLLGVCPPASSSSPAAASHRTGDEDEDTPSLLLTSRNRAEPSAPLRARVLCEYFCNSQYSHVVDRKSGNLLQIHKHTPNQLGSRLICASTRCRSTDSLSRADGIRFSVHCLGGLCLSG